MKLRMITLWHMLRAGYHWNSMIAKIDRTGLLHPTLLCVDRGYAQSHVRYNESIKFLEERGEYVTARSLIAKVRYDLQGSTI